MTLRALISYLTLICLGGFSFGVVCRLGDQLPDPYWWFFNAGGPWLALAFAAGTLTSSIRCGAAYGMGALLSAVIGYYVMTQVVEIASSDHLGSEAIRSFVGRIVLIWIVAALLSGPIFGAAGSLWRGGASRTRMVVVALLGAALVGESLALTIETDGGRTGLLLTTMILAAIALPWLLLRQIRERIAALVLAAGLALLLAGVWTAFIATVRMAAG